MIEKIYHSCPVLSRLGRGAGYGIEITAKEAGTRDL